MAKQPVQFVWFNGDIIPWKQTTMYVITRAILYGPAVFGGVCLGAQVQDAFFGLLNGKTEDKWDWLTPVYEKSRGRV